MTLYDRHARRKRSKLTALEESLAWTVEQDSFLIEHHTWSFEQLREHLPFNDEQILSRKELLGLVRRERQLRKWSY